MKTLRGKRHIRARKLVVVRRQKKQLEKFKKFYHALGNCARNSGNAVLAFEIMTKSLFELKQAASNFIAVYTRPTHIYFMKE